MGRWTSFVGGVYIKIKRRCGAARRGGYIYFTFQMWTLNAKQQQSRKGSSGDEGTDRNTNSLSRIILWHIIRDCILCNNPPIYICFSSILEIHIYISFCFPLHCKSLPAIAHPMPSALFPILIHEFPAHLYPYFYIFVPWPRGIVIMSYSSGAQHIRCLKSRRYTVRYAPAAA